MDTKGQRNRLGYILETYMRSAYTLNAIMIPSIGSLQKMDREFIKTMLRTMLKSRERGITDKGRNKLVALLGIKPYYGKC